MQPAEMQASTTSLARFSMAVAILPVWWPTVNRAAALMLMVRYCGVAKVSQDVRSLANLEQGLLSAQVFVDPAVYELELERIFSRTWLYVAHDSEVPNPGDFVTRSMGEDSVIVVRGSDGLVRVLLNTCRHRGRRLCEL